MPAVKYIVQGCFSSRTTPEVITIQELHAGCRNGSRQMMIDGNLNNQIKNRTLHACRLFLLTQIFNISAIGQEYLSIYPPSFFNNNKHRLIISPNFPRFSNSSVYYAGLYINWEKTFLFVIPDTLSTLKLPIKNHPSSRQPFFLMQF